MSVSGSNGHAAAPAYVGSLRARLWDAGFRPVAIYNHDAKHLSPGKAPKGDAWREKALRDPPEAAVAAVEPDATNTGILCDGLRAIDIDIDNATLAHSIRSMALTRFGEAPMRYRGNSPRVLLLYRAESGKPPKAVVSSTLGKVEVLGAGQQFVAFGTHHTGAPLQWMPEAPGEAEIATIPAIAEQDVQAFLEDAARVLGAKPPGPAASGAVASPHGLGADPLQVVAALVTIPNSGPPDWEYWNRIGMAAWAATGGSAAGRAAWHAWSQQNPAYDPAAADERWNHYATSPPSRIGAGTLFHLAREAAPAQSDEPRVEAEPAKPEAPGRKTGQTGTQGDADKTSLPLLWFEQIEPVLDVKDFVQGVLIEQGAAVVYGESNAGKTFWTTDLALHVAAGDSWHGRRVEQGGVVYCVLEGGIGFKNRVAAWKKARGLENHPIPFVAIAATLNLLDPLADTPRLVKAIKEAAALMAVPVKLVIIDTLSRALAGGNENAPEDMGALVGNMDTIRADTKSCVLFVHHCGKDQAKGARGHSSLRAAIDTEIEVIADEESDAKTATIVKQRDLPKGDHFNFKLKVIELGQNRHGEPVTTCTVDYGDKGAPPVTRSPRAAGGNHQQRALEILSDMIATSGQSGFGVPHGIVSVPDHWWRERFYERAMAGAEQDTKKRAFRRAADALVERHQVGLANGRVWLGKKESEG